MSSPAKNQILPLDTAAKALFENTSEHQKSDSICSVKGIKGLNMNISFTNHDDLHSIDRHMDGGEGEFDLELAEFEQT